MQEGEGSVVEDVHCSEQLPDSAGFCKETGAVSDTQPGQVETRASEKNLEEIRLAANEYALSPTVEQLLSPETDPGTEGEEELTAQLGEVEYTAFCRRCESGYNPLHSQRSVCNRCANLQIAENAFADAPLSVVIRSDSPDARLSPSFEVSASPCCSPQPVGSNRSPGALTENGSLGMSETEVSFNISESTWTPSEFAISSSTVFSAKPAAPSALDDEILVDEVMGQFAGFNQPRESTIPNDQQVQLKRLEEASRSWQAELRNQLEKRHREQREKRCRDAAQKQQNQNSWLQTQTAVTLLQDEGQCSADQLQALIGQTKLSISNNEAIDPYLNAGRIEVSAQRHPLRRGSTATTRGTSAKRRNPNRTNSASARRPSHCQPNQKMSGRVLLKQPVTAKTTREEINEMKQTLQSLDAHQLRKLSFFGQVQLPTPCKSKAQKPDDVWVVGGRLKKGIVFGQANKKNKRKSAAAMRKWKTPEGTVRSLLQHPMERPADVPAIVWHHFHDAFTRVATTPRERKAHMSTLGLSDPKTRGMVLDGVAVSMGNGVERRFYR